MQAMGPTGLPAWTDLELSRNWPTISGKSAVVLKGRPKRTGIRLNSLLIENKILKPAL
jgi:hypothetical protein